MTQADGLLANAYLQQGELQPALAAVDEAIEANKQIPDELYFVPRNLAIKAEILAKLGDAKSSDELYQKSTNIVNAFVEAGAQTVVSTLWELEDHATAHLMTVFYEHLGHAEEKGQSLREAQLQMIASGDPSMC